MNDLRNKLIDNYFGDRDINDYFKYQKELSKIACDLPEEEQLLLFPILKINDSKILLISDTHFGSIYQNYSYLYLVYEYASKYGYNTILHGGDLTQGDVSPRIDKKEKLSRQVLRVISDYPYDKSIKNYILLGNHDHYIYRNIDNSLNVLKYRDDMILLGIRYAYINWCNNLIAISHRLKKGKCKIDFPRIETLVIFHGHRHELFVVNSHVFIPTLSNDIKTYEDRSNYPGFLTAEIADDYLNVQSYVFNDKKIVNRGLVLEKKINERARIN